MADPTGFLKCDRALPTRRPVDIRIRDWKEVYEKFPAAALHDQAGNAWTAASRSATTAARSAT